MEERAMSSPSAPRATHGIGNLYVTKSRERTNGRPGHGEARISSDTRWYVAHGRTAADMSPLEITIHEANRGRGQRPGVATIVRWLAPSDA
eukprot:scaffold18720_cov54-Phaeocystis_antarctica.AAC.1